MLYRAVLVALAAAVSAQDEFKMGQESRRNMWWHFPCMPEQMEAQQSDTRRPVAAVVEKKAELKKREMWFFFFTSCHFPCMPEQMEAQQEAPARVGLAAVIEKKAEVDKKREMWFFHFPFFSSCHFPCMPEQMEAQQSDTRRPVAAAVEKKAELKKREMWFFHFPYHFPCGSAPPNPPPNPPDTRTCSNECNYASDSDCDDGGNDSDFAICDVGTDCVDCGERTTVEMAADTISGALSSAASVTVSAIAKRTEINIKAEVYPVVDQALHDLEDEVVAALSSADKPEPSPSPSP